jgi:hypothetical protein
MFEDQVRSGVVSACLQHTRTFVGSRFCRIGFEPRSSFASSVGLNRGAVAADDGPFHLHISCLLVRLST